MTNLKQGLYILGKTVKNPKADRRKSRAWTAAQEFEAGQRFYLRVPHKGVSPRLEIIGQYGSLYEHEDGFKALAPHLKRSDLTDAEWLELEVHGEAKTVLLLWLMKMDKLTRQDITFIQEEMQRDEDYKARMDAKALRDAKKRDQQA